MSDPPRTVERMNHPASELVEAVAHAGAPLDVFVDAGAGTDSGGIPSGSLETHVPSDWSDPYSDSYWPDDDPPDPLDPRDYDTTSWQAPEPDELELVSEAADLMAVFAAQRLRSVEQLRSKAVADSGSVGGALREVIERGVRLDLAARLRITEHAAGRLLTLAEALIRRYPAAFDSLAHARISEKHADVLVDLIDTAEPAVRERVLPEAIRLAESLPVGRFRRELAELIDTEREATLAERHEAALVQRRVVIEPAMDGMAWLMALMPAVEAHAIHRRLTAIAKAIGEDENETRSRDQIRADALGDLLIDGETEAHPDRARGIRATVAVTVPALALLEDEPSGAFGPAVVEGLGPIPIDRAAELCGGADGWMRVLTHPETGAVLSVGRDQYRPPPSMRRLVAWRAGRCMAPGCNIPASRCEIDHTIAWEDGGTTSVDNLAPLCKGHHTVKHHGGWRVHAVPESGGALRWISPTGREYIETPRRRTPTFSAA